MTSVYEHARTLASFGWHLFPCKAGEKYPITAHGCKDATADNAKLRAFFPPGTANNLAVAAGCLSDVIVLDVDGDVGAAALAALEGAEGPLPRTVESKTPRGRHLFFRYPGAAAPIGNSAGQLADGLDVRTDGGYVVVPPSIRSDGGAYTWTVSPRECAPAPLPDWLLAKLVAKPKPEPAPYRPSAPVSWGHTPYGRSALEQECSDLAAAPEGGRNDKLNRVAFRVGQLVRAGHLVEGMAQAELESAAKACGLQGREVQATMRSGFSAGYADPNPKDPDPNAPRPAAAVVTIGGSSKATPELTSEDVLTAEQTCEAALRHLRDPARAGMASPGRGMGALGEAIKGFPKGTMTTIAGRTGAGKSSLLLKIALNQFAEGGSRHRVGLVSCEDAEWIWGSRIICQLDSNVDPEEFFATTPSPATVARCEAAARGAREYGLHLAYAIGKPLPRILQLVEHMIVKLGCTMIMVDYLQAISAVGQDRYTARTDAAQAIKGLCHDHGAALLIASQLRRPETGNPFKEPNQTEIKDSGDIENMSEAIVLLWPVSDEQNALVLGKVSKVKWTGKRARFAVSRHPHSGALESLVDPPSQQNGGMRDDVW